MTARVGCHDSVAQRQVAWRNSANRLCMVRGPSAAEWRSASLDANGTNGILPSARPIQPARMLRLESSAWWTRTRPGRRRRILEGGLVVVWHGMQAIAQRRYRRQLQRECNHYRHAERGPKNFKIDHPLDPPTNTSCTPRGIVGDDDIYTGNVITTREGQSAVARLVRSRQYRLRYQLTVMAVCASHRVQRSQNHEFAIRSSVPREVPGRLPGAPGCLRQANPLVVEEERTAVEGFYCIRSSTARREKQTEWARHRR